YRAVEGEGAVQEVLQTRQPLVISDVEQYANYPIPLLPQRGGRLHTVVAVPILMSGEVTGVLTVLFSQIGREVNQAEIEALATLGGHAATSLANATAFDDLDRRRRHEQAIVDALADGVVVVDRRGFVTQWNR